MFRHHITLLGCALALSLTALGTQAKADHVHSRSAGGSWGRSTHRGWHRYWGGPKVGFYYSSQPVYSVDSYDFSGDRNNSGSGHSSGTGRGNSAGSQSFGAGRGNNGGTESNGGGRGSSGNGSSTGNHSSSGDRGGSNHSSGCS